MRRDASTKARNDVCGYDDATGAHADSSGRKSTPRSGRQDAPGALPSGCADSQPAMNQKQRSERDICTRFITPARIGAAFRRPRPCDATYSNFPRFSVVTDESIKTAFSQQAPITRLTGRGNGRSAQSGCGRVILLHRGAIPLFAGRGYVRTPSRPKASPSRARSPAPRCSGPISTTRLRQIRSPS